MSIPSNSLHVLQHYIPFIDMTAKNQRLKIEAISTSTVIYNQSLFRSVSTVKKQKDKETHGGIYFFFGAALDGAASTGSKGFDAAFFFFL